MCQDMRKAKVAPGVNAYSGVIAACGKQGKFDTVKGLLREMQESLGRQGKWRRGLRMAVQPNTVVLNAVMSALIESGQIHDAHQVYYDM